MTGINRVESVVVLPGYFFNSEENGEYNRVWHDARGPGDSLVCSKKWNLYFALISYSAHCLKFLLRVVLNLQYNRYNLTTPFHLVC